jgi:dynein heavy chain 1, cytosolic
VSSFVCAVAASLLDVEADAAAQAIAEDDRQAIVKMFAEDNDIPVLLVVAWSAPNRAPARRLELFAGIPNDWRGGDEGALAATLTKNAPTLSASQPLARQLQILSLGGEHMVDALHAYIHRSFKPLLESHFSAGGLPGGTLTEASSRRDVMGAMLVRKKVAELELALRGCQQEVKVADVVLQDHFAPQVIELTGALAKCSSPHEREETRDAFLSACRGSEDIKKVLCASLVACHKDLSDLASRFERRMQSSADMAPATERDFWLRMEEVLKKAHEQTRLPEVECTLDLVKRLKIQQHIPRQLEEDVTSIKSKLEAAQKYNILMREFPVAEILSAPDLASTAAAITKVFEHVKKNLIRAGYPLGRAVQLLEAVSLDVSQQLHQILRKKNLMDMRYEDFQLLCGYTVNARGAVAGLQLGGGGLGGGVTGTTGKAAGGGEAARAGTCKAVFDAWNDREREFVSETSKLRRFHKDAPADGDRLAAAHQELADRMQQLVRFRHAHESLRSVINKVAKLSQARGRGARGWRASGLSGVTSGVTSGSLQRDAQEVLKEAYDVVRGVDSLDTSKDGIDAWLAAMEQYSDGVDKVETQMAANLRNSLGAAKEAKEMFSIFSVFSALLVRPKIRSAIQEYQNKLLMQVKDDVKALQEKFKRKYAASEASRLTFGRDIPPLSGSIIWARQIERQLHTFMRRIQDVLGEGWEDHPEGQKLKTEGDAFRDKLDAGPRFKKWQEEAMVVNREAMSLFPAETFLTNVFRITTSRRSELILEVNFDTGLSELFKEVRSLSMLGFKMIPSIETFALTLQRVYPLAMCMSEAIRIYFHAATRRQILTRPLHSDFM